MMIPRFTEQLLFPAVCCIALMGSCTKTPLGEPEAGLIAFAATDAGAGEPFAPHARSRAVTDGTFAPDDRIGVFAYYLPPGAAMTDATPDFMYNQPVTCTGTGWTYSPVKYWPAEGSVSFFACYPYNDPQLTPPRNTDGGYPVFAYDASGGATDLLVATPVLDRSAGSGAVGFVMRHTLTRVAVYVKSGDDVAEKQVTAFSIHAVKSGTLCCHAPVDAQDPGFGWSFPATPTRGTFAAAVTDFTVPADSAAERQLLCTFFLPPRGAGNTFDIAYTYSGANGPMTVALQDLPLPEADKWQPGAFLSYTLSIDNKEQVAVHSDSYPSWSDGGSQTVEGEIVKQAKSGAL